MVWRWPLVLPLTMLAAVLTGCGTSGAEVSTTRSPAVDLADLVLSYRDTLPGKESNAFVDGPEADVAAATSGMVKARSGDIAAARATLEPLGYEVLEVTDTATNRDHVVLRERTPCQRCWGLFVLRRASGGADAAIEVPHPRDDGRTPEFGIEAYRALDAGVFQMAGTGRDANGAGSEISDMARNPHSMFQQVHQTYGRETQVLQYHGFDADGHPGYPNVVLSNGSDAPQPEISRLADQMRSRRETVGIYDGKHWTDLGATQNPQARHTRSIGGRFFHMEHAGAIRDAPSRRAAMIDATRAALFS